MFPYSSHSKLLILFCLKSAFDCCNQNTEAFHAVKLDSKGRYSKAHVKSSHKQNSDTPCSHQASPKVLEEKNPSIDYNKPARPGLPGAAGQRIKDLMAPFHPSACRPAA